MATIELQSEDLAIGVSRRGTCLSPYNDYVDSVPLQNQVHVS
jgi:hypothetical protein